jgi:hypothetical protein
MDDTNREEGGRAEEASGRFVLRIDPALHASLRWAARAAGASLNEYCARKLSLPTPDLTLPAMEAVAWAATVAGSSLLGVVLFGSMARSEMGEESDADLLIVVAGDLPLSRSLYRSWDENPLRWNGHPVEPHFVHLPQPGEGPSGLWAEVAMEGLVLFDRDLRVSRCLVEVRRAIASGLLIRRRSHGQPYWVGAR